MRRILLASTLVFAIGCSGDDNNTSNNNGDEGFAAGSYTVTVLNVDDQCFDGAMDTIVLPDGTPRALPAPVTMPAFGDLPADIDIEFNEPFDDVMGINVEASGSNGVTTAGTGFPQTGVDISAAADGGCLADMNVTFTLTGSEEGKLTGSGSLSITAATGADCPAFQAGPPCEVISNIEAILN